MDKKASVRKWLWYFSIPAAAILLYKLSDNLGSAVGVIGTLIGILTPFVVGFVLAFFLHAPSRWLETHIGKLKGKVWRKLARPLALVIVYLLLLGIIGLLFYAVIPLLVSSLTGLISSMPQYLEAAGNRIEEFARPDGFLGQIGLASNLTELYQHGLDALSQLLTTENLLTALKGVGNVAASVLDVLIAFIVSVYMLSSREALLREVRAVCSLFIKPRPMKRLRRYAGQIAHIFYNYFYGAFLDALMVGLIATIGLMIFRVPYAALLGMSLGLLNMIPYFGAVIGCIAAAVITLLTSNLYTTIAVVIYLVVIQQVDANIIQPRVIGSSVGLRPIYVLLGITLFGGIFGFWGIFLGVPLMAVVQLFIKDAIRYKRASALLPLIKIGSPIEEKSDN
ncbi:MAG: AI-2E family transporter [Clostridia bacterium]|nr:AI-2E family transporter [Clostridia bacterium]